MSVPGIVNGNNSPLGYHVYSPTNVPWRDKDINSNIGNNQTDQLLQIKDQMMELERKVASAIADLCRSVDTRCAELELHLRQRMGKEFSPITDAVARIDSQIKDMNQKHNTSTIPLNRNEINTVSIEVLQQIDRRLTDLNTRLDSEASAWREKMERDLQQRIMATVGERDHVETLEEMTDRYNACEQTIAELSAKLDSELALIRSTKSRPSSPNFTNEALHNNVLQEVDKMMDALRMEVSNINKDNSEMKQFIRKLQSEGKTDPKIIGDITQLASSIERLQEEESCRSSELRKDSAEVRHKVFTLECRVDAISRRDIQDTLSAEVAEVQSTVTSINAHVNDLRKEYSDIRQRMRALETRVTEISRREQESNQEVAEMGTLLTGMVQTNTNEFKSELSELRQKLRTMESKMNDGRRDDQQELSTLTLRVEEMYGTWKKQQSQSVKTMVDEELREMNNRVRKIEIELGDSRAAKEALEITKRVEQLETQRRSSDNKHQLLESKMNELYSRQISKDMEMMRENIENQMKQLKEDIMSDISREKHESKKWEDQLHDLMRSYQQDRKSMHQAQDEMMALQQSQQESLQKDINKLSQQMKNTMELSQESNNAQIQSRMDQMNKQSLDQVDRKLNSIEPKINQTQQLTDKLKQEIASLTKALQETCSTTDHQQQQIDALSKDISKNINDTKTMIPNVSKQLEQLESEIDKLKSHSVNKEEVNRISNEIKQLESLTIQEIKAMKSSIQQQLQNSAQSDDLRNLQEANNAQNKKISTIESEIKALKSDNQTTNKIDQELNNFRKEIQESIHRLQDTEQTDHKKQQVQIDNLSRDLASMQKTIKQDVSQETNQMKNEIKKLNDELSTTRKHTDETRAMAEEKLNEAQKSLETMQMRLAEERERALGTEGMVDKLAFKLRSREEEVAQLKQNMDFYQKVSKDVRKKRAKAALLRCVAKLALDKKKRDSMWLWLSKKSAFAKEDAFSKTAEEGLIATQKAEQILTTSKNDQSDQIRDRLEEKKQRRQIMKSSEYPNCKKWRLAVITLLSQRKKLGVQLRNITRQAKGHTQGLRSEIIAEYKANQLEIDKALQQDRDQQQQQIQAVLAHKKKIKSLKQYFKDGTNPPPTDDPAKAAQLEQQQKIQEKLDQKRKAKASLPETSSAKTIPLPPQTPSTKIDLPIPSI